MPVTQKISTEDFISKIKQKYPDYKDVDNTTLLNTILQKYPDYKDQIDFSQKKNLSGNKLSVSPKGQLQHSVPITSQSQKSGYDISQNTPEFHVEAPPENPNKIENNFNLNPNEIAKGQIASGENKLSSPQEIENIGYQKAAQEKLDKQNEAANKKFRQTAIDNTIQKSLKLKGINAQKGSLLYNIEKSTYDKQLDNGNAALGTDKRTGQPGLLQSENPLQSLHSHMMDAINENKNSREYHSMNDDEKIKYLNSLQKDKNEYAGTTSNGFGSVLGTLGGAIPTIGLYGAGALAGGALEAAGPETGGLSNLALKPVMSFATNAGSEANKAELQGQSQRYFSIKQQHPELSDKEAFTEAKKGTDVDRLGGIATAGVFSETGGLLGKSVTKSFIKDALKTGVDVGAKTAAVEGAKDIGHNIEGVNVKTPKEIGKDVLNAFEENAPMGVLLHGVMGAVTGAIKNIPNLIKSGLKYDAVTKIPAPEIKAALDKNVQSGAITPEDAGKAEKDLGEFWKALQTVSPHLSDEAKASTAGLIVKRDNIVKSSEGLDPTAKEAIKPQIDAIDNQLREIYRTGKPLSVEINPATGETFEKPTYDNVQKERVQNAADKISKGKTLSDPEDLQAEQQFPDELKNELEKIKKSEIPKEDEVQSDVYKNVNKYLSKNEKENEVPNTQAQTSTANGEVNKNIQPTEKIEGKGEETIPLQVENNDALKDVESTTKALDNYGWGKGLHNDNVVEKSKIQKVIDAGVKGGLDYKDFALNTKKLSEAFHTAKEDGSNPELVKAVEDLLGKSETKPKDISIEGSDVLKKAIADQENIYGKKESKGALQDREDAKSLIKKRTTEHFDIGAKESLAKDLGLPVTYFDNISFKEWSKIKTWHDSEEYSSKLKDLKEKYKDDIEAYKQITNGKEQTNIEEHPEIKNLEKERNAEIEKEGKPDVKLKLITAKELSNSKDAVDNKLEHTKIVNKYKALKELINCL